MNPYNDRIIRWETFVSGAWRLQIENDIYTKDTIAIERNVNGVTFVICDRLHKETLHNRNSYNELT